MERRLGLQRPPTLGLLLLVINLLLSQLLLCPTDVLLRVLLLAHLLLLLLLLVVEVVLVLGGGHIGGLLVMAHHLLLLARSLGHVRNVSVLSIVIGGVGRLLHIVDGPSLLASDLMVLHLLNYLLHVLTGVLQLGKLLLEPDVERLERDDFLGLGHTLDTS